MPKDAAASIAVGRRATIVAGFAFVAGCGGGGSGPPPPTRVGTLQTTRIDSRINATPYPLNVYLPPDSDKDRATLPVVYLLDGESRFQALVDIVDGRERVIIIGIGNEALRARDYVPPNSCTTGGGGQGEFFDFIRAELIPFVEATFGGDPLKRILLGHSHGGSFVLYALFNEANSGRHFKTYLASDASISCMTGTVYGWESAYAAANTALPVRLHISYSANVANDPFAQQVQARNYTGLALAAQFYAGGHIGMIPMAFTDAMAFALA
jgi:hypothetical protein